MADSSVVSVVIPALDEAATIGDVVRRLRAAGPWREVLVVDDTGEFVLIIDADDQHPPEDALLNALASRFEHGPDR